MTGMGRGGREGALAGLELRAEPGTDAVARAIGAEPPVTSSFTMRFVPPAMNFRFSIWPSGFIRLM